MIAALQPIAAALAVGAPASGPADAAPMPDRAAVAAALIRWMACEAADCPPRRQRTMVRSLRCRPMAEATGPARVLCRFSGHYELIDGSRVPFPAECAYFWRPAGAWTVMAVPDHDLCDV